MDSGVGSGDGSGYRRSASRILVLATAGAGGDLQPLIAAALVLETRGHEVDVLGDRSVARVVTPLGFRVATLPSELDLGPALVAAVTESVRATGGDLHAAGSLVRERMSEWAVAVAGPVRNAISADPPDTIVTSLFGVEVLDVVKPRRSTGRCCCPMPATAR